MATNPNMEAIETITVGATSVDNITFSNIPQTYTDLVIKLSARNDAAAIVGGFWVEFNGVTTNLSSRFLYGGGTTYGSVSDTTAIFGYANSDSSTTSTFNNAEIYIPNYAGSNYKSVSIDSVMETNAAGANMTITAGLWSSTAAITSIKLRTFNNSNSAIANFKQYSSATLYGITSAAKGAKATGGIISETDTHWIHTFTASGTFTPSQNLTADYLVVAGGGSGAFPGGGGGAGGFRTNTSQSFTNGTAYTVTVGAGASAPASGNRGNQGSNSSIAGSGMTTFSSTGGGGGGRGGDNAPTTGGSGGGAGRDGYFSGANGNAGGYTPSEGNNGGTGPRLSFVGGAGGGGAGAVGGNGGGNGNSNGETAGAGGAGLSNSYSGTAVTYAGGGGGGNEDYGSFGGTGGAGGSGGGGAGSANTNSATSGTANTGGGGGGTGRATATSTGAGGSGIVIVRYAK